MVRKDIVSELRSRETVVSMFLFVVLGHGRLSLRLHDPGAGGGSGAGAGDGDSRRLPAACSGWCSSSAPCSVSTARSPTKRTKACLDGLLLCPVDRVTIFLAKMTANLIFLGLIQLLAVPVFALFFAAGRMAAHLPAFFALVVLADVGIAALGTLLATIAMHTRARDLLLPILFLPLVIPLLIAAASGTSAVLAGSAGSVSVLGRLAFLLVYDGVFLVLAYGTYDVAIGE